ncbi:MAG: hypothetical protein LBF68_00200 [Christensenellaceae bacterium]|jgi:hypothetical protein|nr:hypothetical protein [Christensenellaceae bacterium]
MNYEAKHPSVERKKSRYRQRYRQRLPCPACGFRVIDAEIDIHSELHIMEKGDSWNGDYFAKCERCKSDIGIRKIE